MIKWVASLNGEEFDYEEFEKKEDAIEYLKELAEEEELKIGYIGQSVDYIPRIDADCLVERLGEEVYEEIGDCAETYLEDVQKEHLDILDEKLNEVLSDWLKEYNYEPNFSKVEKIRKVDIIGGEK